MFYLVLIPILIYSLLIIYKLNMLKKHDHLLFDFCQIRRDLLEYLRNRYDQLTVDEYKTSKFLLTILDATIHDYNQLKSRLFNLRIFTQIARNYSSSVAQIEKIEIPNTPEMQLMYKNFILAMLKGFLSYTPWLKSEVALKLFASLLKAFAKSKIGYFSSRAAMLLNTYYQLDRQAQHFGLEPNMLPVSFQSRS